MLTVGPAVTWIKVEKPEFDLVGVVLGSFRLAGVLLFVALVLGVLFGVALVRARRRLQAPSMDAVSLHLGR
jgi:ABC-type spermidine/putrescine transport system permease subunit II